LDRQGSAQDVSLILDYVPMILEKEYCIQVANYGVAGFSLGKVHCVSFFYCLISSSTLFLSGDSDDILGGHTSLISMFHGTGIPVGHSLRS
jgi:hypothetical protein